MKTTEYVESPDALRKAGRPKVELLCDSDTIRDELVCGLISLGFEIVLAPNGSNRPIARVRVLEEGVEAPSDGIPFIVVAETRSLEGYTCAVASGASGYFICPLDIMSLGAALHAASANGVTRERQTDRFSETLTVDQTISTVVGILMERFGSPRLDAYARLRRHSRDERRKLVDVAAEIINASERLSSTLQSIEAVAID